MHLMRQLYNPSDEIQDLGKFRAVEVALLEQLQSGPHVLEAGCGGWTGDG